MSYVLPAPRTATFRLRWHQRAGGGCGGTHDERATVATLETSAPAVVAAAAVVVVDAHASGGGQTAAVAVAAAVVGFADCAMS